MTQPEVEVTTVEDDALWDQLVGTHGHGNAFHDSRWLRAAEAESGTRLHLLRVLRGDQTVGLLPVHTRRAGPVRCGFSPAPGCAVPELGPLFVIQGRSRRSEESLYFQVVDALSSYLEDRLKLSVLRMGCQPGVVDVRPFLWRGYRSSPFYSYVVPLTSLTPGDWTVGGRQLRRDARRALKYDGLTIVDGDGDAYRGIISLVRDRYRAQGRAWKPSDAYLHQLHESLGRDHLAVKAALFDGELIGGLILIKAGRTVRHWLGGTPPARKLIGVNELLHYTVLDEYSALGYEEYELVGANTRNLCNYKSKFDPLLRTQYAVTRSLRLRDLVRL